MGGLLAADAVKDQNSILVKGETAKLCPGEPTPLPSACCDSNPSGPACYRVALFDAVNAYEAANSEKPWVDYILSEGSNWRLFLSTSSNGNTAYKIKKSIYSYSQYPDFSQGGPQLHGKSAGIGVMGSGFYELSNGMDLVEKAFKDSFVETKTTSTQIGATPYLPPTFFDDPNQLPRLRFSKIWFNNCWQGSDWVCNSNNHFHIMGVGGESVAAWGRTQYDRSNVTFQFIGKVEMVDQCPGNLENCKQHLTVHETAHQFIVNPDNCDFHDTNLAWCSNPTQAECGGMSDRQCPMWSVEATQRFDGIERFDVRDLFTGMSSSGQLVCTDPPETHIWQAGEGSIRKLKEPM
jgi:hypothetical protein